MKKRKTPVVAKHILIPVHTKLNDKEKSELFEKYNITFNELPKMVEDDPAIASLNPKPGDIIKIIRKSPTASEALFYRGVTNV